MYWTLEPAPHVDHGKQRRARGCSLPGLEASRHIDRFAAAAVVAGVAAAAAAGAAVDAVVVTAVDVGPAAAGAAAEERSPEDSTESCPVAVAPKKKVAVEGLDSDSILDPRQVVDTFFQWRRALRNVTQSWSELTGVETITGRHLYAGARRA